MIFILLTNVKIKTFSSVALILHLYAHSSLCVTDEKEMLIITTNNLPPKLSNYLSFAQRAMEGVLTAFLNVGFLYLWARIKI